MCQFWPDILFFALKVDIDDDNDADRQVSDIKASLPQGTVDVNVTVIVFCGNSSAFSKKNWSKVSV